MTGYVKYGRGFSADDDACCAVTVPASDVALLDRDLFMFGSVFLRPTDQWHDGVRVYTRTAPSEYFPSWVEPS